MSDLLTQLTEFSSATRLYALSIKDRDAELIVEAFAAIEELHTVGARDIIVLSTDAEIELKTLLGQGASLQISLSDGTRTSFTGLINEAAQLGSDGSLSRYRIRVVPWLWLLGQSRTSRIWQDTSVIDIVESVFQEYPDHAAWQWSSDAISFLADVRPRSTTTQYRETHLAFVRRLLAEESLSFRIEESQTAPSGHQVILFADSTYDSAFPEDATSRSAIGGAGIRYHAGRAVEAQDTVIALGCKRSLRAARVTVASYDYASKRIVAVSVPTKHDFGGKDAPMLESYDTPGAGAYSNAEDANHYATLHMEASEARNKTWYARSTVRTLRAGTNFTLTQSPVKIHSGDDTITFTLLNVTSVGLNNLPKPASEALAELFGPIPELLEESIAALSTLGQHDRYVNNTNKKDRDAVQFNTRNDLAAVITKATELGYANRFDAIRNDIVWRPVQADGTGLLHNPRPTTNGSQTAIVIGANGEASPNGADEIYCDRLGRIRIRFHWQGQHDDSNATCWVRVAQRIAGPGMGIQFLPRIGQEVLVKFLENDIDRPIVMGGLYNGQGEGGTIPTPGGNRDKQAIITIFEGATDHRTGGQANLAGANSPVWHGASPDSQGHNNAGAQWGIRSKEFGGSGYNQLLFDDTNQQGRIQLKTTKAATELNLGHLIHTADNFRGSFRGTGVEMRTDAYGTIRAGAGFLLSSYGVAHHAKSRLPAGDNWATLALLKQALTLAETFNQAATTHQSVSYAAHRGSSKTNASVINDQAAPLKALYIAAAGMVSGDTLEQARQDAQSKNITPDDDKLPHTSAPIISIAAKAGLGVVAGQDVQLANGETVSIMSGQDTQFVTGGQTRIHSGQAIGILAGAVKPGEDNVGLQLIAALQKIELQAQSDDIEIQAKDMVNVISANSHIDWAAAKWIKLSTAGGAYILIADGKIEIGCPGKILIQASLKEFVGPDRLSYPLPKLPKSLCKRCRRSASASGSPFSTVEE